MNSLNIISPYKFNGQWVFDDPSKNLVREPFVAGADNIIDKWVQDIPNAWRGFTLIFSAHSFPDAQKALLWSGPEHGGNWYRERNTSIVGWLCPALLKYFETAPEVIYVQVKQVWE